MFAGKCGEIFAIINAFEQVEAFFSGFDENMACACFCHLCVPFYMLFWHIARMLSEVSEEKSLPVGPNS